MTEQHSGSRSRFAKRDLGSTAGDGLVGLERRKDPANPAISAPNEAVDLYEMDADDTFSVERRLALDSSLGILPNLAPASAAAGIAQSRSHKRRG